MKRTYTLLIVSLIILSMLPACSSPKKTIQINDTLDISKVSNRVKIEDAYMTKVFGIYGEVKNSLGITVQGHVENGKIQENSEIFFVDDKGKVIYKDRLFKIEIVLRCTGSEYETKRQSFADSGDDVLLYLKYDEDDVIKNDSKYAGIVDVLRTSHFAVLE